MIWKHVVMVVIHLLLYGSVIRTKGMGLTSRRVTRPKVLVISLDGFDHDYLSLYQWEYLSVFYSHGSHPQRFRNQFVTKTFPNHFSVATGVYEEVHGVVGNSVFDPDLNQTFTITDEGLFTQNPNISPIWTLNEEHGGHSGCIMWPGCGTAYHGKNVTFWSPYHENASIIKSIDTAIEWLTNEQTPGNLVFLYHSQPDLVGHAYGPHSLQLLDELKKIDEGLRYLYHMLNVHELKDTVDVIILSDHGMSAVKDENIIDLDTIIDPNQYFTSGNSPVLNIWTSYEDQLDIFLKLQKASKMSHFKVYTKSDPQLSSWHYANNSRIGQIILVADDGYVFQDFRELIDHFKNKGFKDMTDTHGDHGYPVEVASMEPIFVAAGPSFKRGFQAPEFSNVDVYVLLCHLLSLNPGPHNGTWDNISSILMEPVSSTLIRPLSIALGCVMALLGLIGILACVLTRQNSRKPVSADSLISGYVYRKTMREGKEPLEDISEEECLLDAEVNEEV
ncbi:bis(5'-adenosyl)-triphosphatase enpp4-like [Panulirus ornatus]|uniref:bis(5'-adenosyl)-triphosphatase enpp4-like n=1 Tax=Panulirus ornatus TaxID=150431 RepID=UPI003A8C6992